MKDKRLSNEQNSDEHKGSVNITYQNISSDISDIDEDFSNAMDVLCCILGENNKSIVNELFVVYERKSALISKAYRLGIVDGSKLEAHRPPKTTFGPHNHS